jgi:fatty-acyl-CoA synthase
MRVIGDVVRLNAKRYPDKKALIMDDRFLTYGQINRQVNQLAHGLISRGIASGDKVAVLALNCLEYPIIVYAIAKTGAVTVPVNFRYKRDELVYLINNSEPKLLFYGPEFSDLVEEARLGFERPVELVGIGNSAESGYRKIKELMEGQSESEPTVSVDPAAPFAVMYTSGTTGFPKGTISSHAAYLEVFKGMAYEGDLKFEDVSLVCIPLFHNGGLNGMLQPAFMVGASVVIMSKGFDPDLVLDTVQRHRITTTMWVPTQLTMLVNHPNIARWDLSSLTKIYYGSSTITPATLEASLDVFKSAGFYQWYGQVETGMVSVLRPEDHKNRSQSTGREMFNADLKIVDPEGGQVGVGQTGEIVSAQMPLGMIGYYKMDEENTAVIRNGWIYTGDIALLEDGGYFTIVDRVKDVIISGAENIYPREIENVISRYAGVFEVAVFGIPDEIYGEAVCAAVVPKAGQQLRELEIIEYCASRISSYKKPKKVIFLEELPKNANGKVTKNVLRQPFWAGRKRLV